MKKFLLRLFLAFVIVFLIIFVSAYIFILIQGKSLAVSNLEKLLNRKVSLDTIRLTLPLALEIKGLNIQDFLSAKEIVIWPNIGSIFTKKIIFSKIMLKEPSFYIERQPDGNWNIPVVNIKKQSSKTPILISLFIEDGSLSFLDKKVSPIGFNLIIDRINLNISNNIFSLNPFLTRFNLQAIAFGFKENPYATINANGWIDFVKKDMDGNIDIKNIDGVYFQPYYPNLGGSPLKSAQINFNSDLVAENNDLTATCHLSVNDLSFAQPTEQKTPSISFLDIFTGVLQPENKEINIDFEIKTKLDNPRVDMAKLSGNIIAKTLGEQVIKSPQQTVDNIKNVGKQFEKIGKDFLKGKLGDILGVGNEEENSSQPQNPNP